MRRFFWVPKINVNLENTILHIYLSIYLSIYLFFQFIHGLTWQVDVIKKRIYICSEVIDSITDANSGYLGYGLGWFRCGLRWFGGSLGWFEANMAAQRRALTRILKTWVQDSLLAKSRSPTGKSGSPIPKKLESHQVVHTVYLFHFSRKWCICIIFRLTDFNPWNINGLFLLNKPNILVYFFSCNLNTHFFFAWPYQNKRLNCWYLFYKTDRQTDGRTDWQTDMQAAVLCFV